MDLEVRRDTRRFPVRYARHAGLALLLIGLLLVGWGIYEFAGGRIYQAIHGSEVDREIDQAIESAPQQPVTAGKTPRPNYQLGSAIGKLEIPRLGVSVVVLEGSAGKSLRLGVGRLHNSALPGETGNVVLAGHRDTFFRPLKGIRKGDVISLRTPQGTFPYQVEWTEVVDPKDVSVLKKTDQPALTLVTCYPFYWVGSAPQRFIVRARALDSGPASAVSSVAPAPVPAKAKKESPFAVPSPRTRPVRVASRALVATPMAATPTAAHPDTAEAELTRIALKPDEPMAAPELRKRGLKRLDPRNAVRKVAGLFSRRAKIQ